MNKYYLKILSIFLFSTLLAFSFITAVNAEESAEAKTTIPATVPEIWKAIDSQTTDLKKTISENKLSEVHHYAYAIRDLVAALLTHADALPADKLDEVKKQNKFVVTIVDRLDETGDKADKPATESNFVKLQKVIGDIRSTYNVAPN